MKNRPDHLDLDVTRSDAIKSAKQITSGVMICVILNLMTFVSRYSYNARKKHNFSAETLQNSKCSTRNIITDLNKTRHICRTHEILK